MIKLNKEAGTWILYLYTACIPFFLITGSWEQFLVAYLMHWFLIDVVMSMFLHLYSAHNLWNPPVWIQRVLAFIGVISLVGTPIAWAAWHRTHHVYVDSEKDPHSPIYKSIFYIVFRTRFHTMDVKRGSDRLRNKYFLWLTKYEALITIISNLIIFGLFMTFSNFYWFLAVWAVPSATMILATNYGVNVLAHKNGKAEDIVWLWPVLFGEVWHGKHHNGPKLSFSKFVPGAMLIKLFGWTKNDR